MERHLDLVRNDWDREVQERVARLVIGDPETSGLIVKAEGRAGDWERMVFDALGPLVQSESEKIVSRLAEAFRGPYLVVNGPHGDEACPFATEGSRPMRREEIERGYSLPPVDHAAQT